VGGYEGISAHDEPHNFGRSMKDWQPCVGINSVDLRKLHRSVYDQELGKTECVFDILRRCLSTSGYSKYILAVAESISIIAVAQYVYIVRDIDNTCYNMMWRIL
jgi:hypothetical protein